MGNLSLAYTNRGWWKEAEELGVRVAQIKRVLVPEDPNTLMSMNNLAWT